MDLKRITYTSRARLDLTDDDLADIHRLARDLNGFNGITGILVFDGIRFLQVLEGPVQAVDELMERLRRDPRHSSIEVREDRSVEAGAFSGWSMELVRVSAGYFRARPELDTHLPSGIPAETRARILSMAGELAADS